MCVQKDPFVSFLCIQNEKNCKKIAKKVIAPCIRTFRLYGYQWRVHVDIQHICTNHWHKAILQGLALHCSIPLSLIFRWLKVVHSPTPPRLIYPAGSHVPDVIFSFVYKEPMISLVIIKQYICISMCELSLYCPPCWIVWFAFHACLTFQKL